MQLPPPPPIDRGVPELQTLLGAEAGELLAAALARPVAACRPTYVRYSPGRSATVAYSAEIETSPNLITVAAYTGARTLAGTTVVGAGPAEVSVWRFPYDPDLPGLGQAADSTAAARLLREVGIQEEIRRLYTRSYRPRRRAVIEVATDKHRLFIKVVRPSKVAALQQIHRLVSSHLRVPRSLGFSEELGIAVLEPIEGMTLRQAVGAGATTLAGAAELTGLLEALPPTGTPRPGIIERLSAHGAYLARILPDQAPRLTELVDQVGGDDAPLVPAHNDFHSSQVLVGEDGITGLIDIDTVGPGRRADDYAMLLAHLHSLALGRRGDRYARYGSSLLPAFESEVDRDDLRRRIAAAMVGFATSPFRNQHLDWPSATIRRIEAAEAWLP